MPETGTLVFFCGKMAAGKSTRARAIATDLGAIRLSEDEWLTALYPAQINDFADYRKYASRLKPLLKHHVQALLHAGLSVVMDFPGNTPQQRAWFTEILAPRAFPHKLIYLEADDEVCLRRLATRRESAPERWRFDTEDVFRHVTGYFQPPSPEEGFNVEIIRQLTP